MDTTVVPYGTPVKSGVWRVPDWEVAKDLPKRLADLRRVLGLTHQQMGELFGRGRKQSMAWEQGRQLPAVATLERAARQHDWPVGMFAKGGPMPREVLGNARRVGEEVAPPYGAAGSDSQLSEQDLFRLVITDPDAFVAKMERWQGNLGADEVLSWLDDAEAIVREKHGANMARFFNALRERVKKGKG